MRVIYEPKGRALEYSLLAINHYTGCVHGCTYCYVPSVLHMPISQFNRPKVRPNVLERLASDAPKYAGTDKRILLCFTCDPYQQLDEKEKVTRSVIKILKDNDIPFQVLTKGGTWAVRDFKFYGPHDVFGTTMTFLDDEKSRKYEPHAALPEDRIDAIWAAKTSWGIETFVSLEPVIDPEQSLEIIQKTSDIVDLFKIGKMNHVETEINWREFGIKAIELCNKLQKRYYIKNDLAAYLNGIEYTNFDTRRYEKN